MRTKMMLLVSTAFLALQPVQANANESEIQLLREQIQALTARLDALESHNQDLTQSLERAESTAVARSDVVVEEKVNAAVSEMVDERMAAVSWAERLKWGGDFRFRYENIGIEGKEDRNRWRIRARTNLTARVTPTVKVGIGLATGGDDPVSSNQTIGSGGSTKGLQLDLAYFDWSGLTNTRITGGKYKNFLIRPGKKGLLWDGDWRPEGLGLIWDNGTFFAQGLGTWLEGDSKKRTQFSWATQGGMKFKIGDNGKLKFGAGYSEFNIAGRHPLFGTQQKFYGNSFVFDPVTDEYVFKYDYHQVQAFAEYGFKLGGHSVALFGDYTVNTVADENDTGYLFGAKFGSLKKQGDWDFTYFYERLEKDATVGLLTDSDFGGGGTDSKGHVFSSSYAFAGQWKFKATYFINDILISTDNPRDFDRLQLDLSFKFK